MPFKCRHSDLTPKGCLCDTDRLLNDHIITLPLEDRIWHDTYIDVQIPGRRPTLPCLTLPTHTQPRTIIYPCRDLHRYLLPALYNPTPLTRGTYLLYHAPTPLTRSAYTRCHEPPEWRCLSPPYLTRATTRLAGPGHASRPCTAPPARLTRHSLRYLDNSLSAKGCGFERYLQFIDKVTPPLSATVTTGPRTLPKEDVKYAAAKVKAQVSKDILKVGGSEYILLSVPVIYTFMPIPVILCSLRLIREHTIRF